MKLNNIHNNFSVLIGNTRFILVFFVAVFSLTFMFKNQVARAVTQQTLTGSCGIIFTTNINGWEGVAKTYGTSITINAIGTINFDQATFAGKFANVTPYGNSTHVDEVFYTSTGALTLVSFTTSTGVYEYTATDSSSPTDVVHLSVLPVNSGNTFLITAYSSSSASSTTPVASGVCQKV